MRQRVHLQRASPLNFKSMRVYGCRWECSIGSGGGAWAGAHLPTVQIGMSGQFLFVVLRAADNKGHHRYLVRGGGGATPAELAKAAALEVSAGLPAWAAAMQHN